MNTFRGILCLAFCAAAPLLAAASVATAQPGCNEFRIGPPKTDPRHPFMHCFQPYGFMKGWITASSYERYGSDVVALGDINHDTRADFAVQHERRDTLFDGTAPVEWFVYHGVRGGLPDPRSGQRIGPTEVGSQTRVLCAGDWDADGNQDVVATTYLMGNQPYSTVRVVVLWGSADGTFSIDDTTRLVAYDDLWLGAYRAVSSDLDGDGVQDLVVWGGGGLNNGKEVRTPDLFFYKGHRGQRWGRGGIVRTADLGWWVPPPMNWMQAADQDCDGHPDIVLVNQARNGTGQVSVLYGRTGQLPDTAEMQTVDLALANGHQSRFTDLTGDHVPEFITACGAQEVIKIFVGRPGQRLTAMIGSGIDTQNRRPWGTIRLPKAVDSDNWFPGGFEPLYDLGDLNLDGVSDIFIFTYPIFSLYTGGREMDSYIDAGMWNTGGVTSATRLGDIDGSGRASFAVNRYGANVLEFYHATDSVPPSGEPFDLPHDTDFVCQHAASVAAPAAPQAGPSAAGRIVVTPNPARGELRVSWSGLPSGPATVRVVNTVGALVFARDVAGGIDHIDIETASLPRALYLVTVTCGARRVTGTAVLR